MSNCILAQHVNYNKDSLIAAVLQSISPDSVRQTIQSLQDFNTRFALAPDHKDVALFIQKKLITLGYSNTKLDSFFLDSIYWPLNSGILNSSWQYNVIAQFDGMVDNSKIYILGAHYDNIVIQGDAYTTVPGADDNASGIAAMLETARVFKLHNIQPAYTIRFVAFSSEEFNLDGSNNYAFKVGSAGENIALMINNDMIAHNHQPANAWKFTIQKYPNTDWVETLTDQIVQNFTQLTPVVATNDITHSDSYLFNLWGYNAVFYQEYDFNTYLHTISDIIDSLDMNYCAEVTKVSCGMLLSTNLISTSTENIKKNELSTEIYPNPVRNNLNISINSNKNQLASVSVFDINNHLLLEEEVLLSQSDMNEFVFDLKTFSEGIYYCIIKTSQSVNCQKIIKL